jgi:uncharacterized membrane protein YdjX (TVP38/TMEM64 family)
MFTRSILIFIATSLIMLGGFALWGDYFESLFETNNVQQESPGVNAASFAILLLWADPLLPIPVTLILATFGASYGFWIGTILGVVGTVGSGLVAYSLCRYLPDSVGRKLLGDDMKEYGHRLVMRHGIWIIALSRWMAILPEILSGFAGLLGMPFRIYLVSLIMGTVPMSMVYAWMGSSNLFAKHPLWGLVFSAFLPLAAWLLVRKRFRHQNDDDTSSSS